MTQPLQWRDMLAELIAANTISSADPALDRGNRTAAEQLAERLRDCGFECAIQPLPNRADKVNLTARIGGSAAAASEQGLVFAGHLDTVPHDAEGWSSDPFELVERDERLYGLGVADMKGFLALGAGVAGEYAGRRLAAPLTLLISCDEECGMDGARALRDGGGLAPGRHCIIGEPTGLVPIRRHKGIFMDRIVVHGAAGHSSNPALGANAIDAMHLAVAALRELRAELRAGSLEADFPVPHATLNLGAIHGGDNANRIPASCTLDLDLRFLPGMDMDGLRSILRARVRRAVADSDCTVSFDSLFAGTPAFATAADAAIVAACERLSGSRAQAVDFGTEGAFYNQMGMETVILGPGDIAQAHQPDEFLALERIAPMQQMLRALVEQFCVQQ